MPRIYSQDFMSFIFTGVHRFSIHNAPRSVSNGEIARRAMHEIKKNKHEYENSVNYRLWTVLNDYRIF